MIALVIEDGKMVEYHLFGKRVSVTLCQRECTFICFVDQWNLFLPHTIEYVKKDSVYYGRNIQIKDIENGISSQIYFYEYENRYERYICKELIHIGNDSNADIAYPTEITIDTTHHTIETNAPFVSINHTIRQFSYYTIGTVLLSFNLKLIFGKDYLLIRKMNGVIKLQKWINQEICASIPLTTWLQQPSIKRIEFPYHILIKEPVHLPKPYETNILATMLPSIMMLSSTTMISMLHAYVTYQNTGSYEQAVFMVLMPTMMLFVTCISFPLQKWLRYHQYRKQTKKNQNEYEIYLMQELKKFQKKKEKWLENQNQRYPTFHQIIVSLQQHQIPKMEEQLCLGMVLKSYEVEIKIEGNIKVDENTYQTQLDYFFNKCKEPILQPYLYQKDRNVCIFGTYAVPYFLSLLLKVGFMNTCCCLLCSREWLIQYPWILKLPSFTKEQKRNIYDYDQQLVGLEQFAYVFTTEKKILPVVSIYLSSKSDSTCLNVEVNEDGYLMNEVDGKIPLQFDYCNEIIPNIPYMNQISRSINNPSFLDLYHCDKVEELFILERWEDNRNQRDLVAPIGIDDNQQIITLGLSEKRHGPHGLVAGTTGSGKSQLLITLVLSLIVNYSSYDFQTIFIDFKGGGMAQSFKSNGKYIPHLIGSLTNLEPAMIERVLCALHRECETRQRRFNQASSLLHKPITNITEYVMYQKEHQLENIADLLIVVDEFAQLKSSAPEFLDELISISRIGRSLGIHLLLCTQKPAGIVNDQIWANSKFKICLKVREKHDSLEVLHNDSALYLKKAGEFVFECDGIMQKGISGYSGCQKTIQKGNCQILGLQGNVEDDYKQYCALEEQQVQLIVNHIIEMNQDSQKPLWNEPLQDINYSEFIQKHAFAVIDDFYENKLRYLSFQKNEHYVFLCPNQEINDHFSRFIQLLEKDHITSIDLKENRLDTYEKQLQEKTDKLWLVRDTREFYEVLGAMKIHQLIENSQENNNSFIFLVKNTSIMPYRDLNLCHHKIALQNQSMDELSSFLNMKINEQVKGRKDALCKDKYLYRMKVGLVDYDE